MGHYYSEMVSDDEQEKAAKFRKERRKKIVDFISYDIADRGLADVLADIVDDPQMYRISIR
jgi:hypothetical protein